MKFNKENFPVINWMRNPKLSLNQIVKSKLSDNLDIMKAEDDDFDTNNIDFISRPFLQAMNENRKRLFEIIDKERFSEEKSIFSGLLLLSTGESIIYNIYAVKEGVIQAFYSICLVLKKNKIIAEEFYHSHYYLGENRVLLNEGGIKWTDFVILFYIFRQYSELEVKQLPASTGGTPKIVGAYQNQTKSNIKIWDSLWFTTLVKSDSFKVRGHFRLQPYGQGLKERKLIWINEFTKDGYERRAKMLNDNQDTL